MVKTTARNSYLPCLTWGSRIKASVPRINRVRNWNCRRLHSTIITPFSILLLVSWKTLAELDAADPLENMWRWKEAYRQLRFPLKVSEEMTSRYFQTLMKVWESLIKFSTLPLTRGKHHPLDLVINYVTSFRSECQHFKWTVTTRSSQLTKRDERVRWCQDFDRPTTSPFHNFSTTDRWIKKRSSDKKLPINGVPRPLAATHDSSADPG